MAFTTEHTLFLQPPGSHYGFLICVDWRILRQILKKMRVWPGAKTEIWIRFGWWLCICFSFSEWADRAFDIVFSTWGLPQSIISDQDPKFTSEFWQAIFRRANTRLGITSAYHPNADGQSEKSNDTVKITLRCLLTQWFCNLQYMWLSLDRAPKIWNRAKASFYSWSVLSHDHCTPNKF